MIITVAVRSSFYLRYRFTIGYSAVAAYKILSASQRKLVMISFDIC
jgi:hypothetical protein